MSDQSATLRERSELDILRDQVRELTDAHVEISDQMLALYELSEFSAASLDPLAAASITAERTQTLLNADWVAFYRQDVGGALTAIAEVEAEGVLRPGEQLILSDTAIRFGDSTEPYISQDEITGRSILGVPVDAEDTHFGILVAASALGEHFSTSQVKLTRAVTNQLAIMLKLSESHKAEVRRSLIARDYNIASSLAQSALKRPVPEVPMLDVAVFTRPARAAGGDFYAAARSPNGLFLAMGDVSGKGLPAALIMTSALSATYAAFERSSACDPAEVLTDIDHQMWSHLNETGVFITLAVAHINPEAGRLTIGNAGHYPVLLQTRDGVTPCTPHVPPVGVLDDAEHQTSAWDFGPGDLLFIGSDGWTDQHDPAEEQFGDDRLIAALADGPDTDANALIAHLVDQVDGFASGTDQVDDLTATIVRGK